MSNNVDPRYPIGEEEILPYSERERENRLADLLFLPRHLEFAVLNLDEKQLLTPYREGGWNLKQVVHHVADSHMNGYTRFKLGLTEDNPTVKPYDEVKWALLPDVANVPINISLTLLHALHARWYEIAKNVSREDWQRTVYHPGSKRTMTVWDILGSYAWHGRHHTAHITALREKMNW
jgi:uncharacterized damage-inducible protein DinB